MCLTRALAGTIPSDSEIFLLWEVYTGGVDTLIGSMTRQSIEAGLRRLLEKAAAKHSPLARPQHNAVRACLEAHIPGAAVNALATLKPHSREPVLGARYRDHEWYLKPSPPGPKGPGVIHERVVFTELDTEITLQSDADADSDAESLLEVDSESGMDFELYSESESESESGSGSGSNAISMSRDMFAASRARIQAATAANRKRLDNAARVGLGVDSANYWQLFRGAAAFKGVIDALGLLCAAPAMPPAAADDKCPARAVARPGESAEDRERRLNRARTELRQAFTRFDPRGQGALPLRPFTSMLAAAVTAAVHNPRLFPEVQQRTKQIGSKELRVLKGCIKEQSRTHGQVLFARYLRLGDPLSLPLTGPGSGAAALAARDLTFPPMRMEPLWFRHTVCAIAHSCVNAMGLGDDGPQGLTVQQLLHLLWMRTLRVMSDINRANARVLVAKTARKRFTRAAQELLKILAPKFLSQRAEVLDAAGRSARGLLASQYIVSQDMIMRRHPGAIAAAASALATGAILDTFTKRNRMARAWTTYDPSRTFKLQQPAVESALHSKLDRPCTQRMKAGEDGFDIARDQACQCARKRVPAAAREMRNDLDRDSKGYISAEDYFLSYTDPDAFDIKASKLLQECAARVARSADDIAAEYNALAPITPRSIEINWEKRIRSSQCQEPGWPHIAKCMLPRAPKDALSVALDLVARDPSHTSKAGVSSGGGRGGHGGGVVVSMPGFSANPYLIRDGYAALAAQCRETTDVRAAIARDTAVWKIFAEDRSVIINTDVERVICMRLAKLAGLEAAGPVVNSFLALGETLSARARSGAVPDSVSFLEAGTELAATHVAAVDASSTTGTESFTAHSAQSPAAAAVATPVLASLATLTPALRATAACISRGARVTAKQAIVRVDHSIRGPVRGRIESHGQLQALGDGRVTRCEFDSAPRALDETIDELFTQCGAQPTNDARRVMQAYTEPGQEPEQASVSATVLEERYNEQVEQARAAVRARRDAAVAAYQKASYTPSHTAQVDGRAVPVDTLKDDAQARTLALAQFEAVAECALDLTRKAAKQVIHGMVLHVEGVDAVLSAASASDTGSGSFAEEAAYITTLADAVGFDVSSPSLVEAMAQRARAPRPLFTSGGKRILAVDMRHVTALPYALASGAKSIMQRCELATNTRVHRLWMRYAPAKSTWETRMRLRTAAAASAGSAASTMSWLAEAERKLDAMASAEHGPAADIDEERVKFIPRDVVEEMLTRMVASAANQRLDTDEDDAVAAAARKERARQGYASFLEAGAGLGSESDPSTATGAQHMPGYALFARCVRSGIPAATDRVLAYFLPKGAVNDVTQTPSVRATLLSAAQAVSNTTDAQLPNSHQTQRLLDAAARAGRIEYRDWLRRQLGPMHIPLDPPHPWGQSCPNLAAVFSGPANDAAADRSDVLASAVLSAARSLAARCDAKVNWGALFNEIIHRSLEPLGASTGKRPSPFMDMQYLNPREPLDPNDKHAFRENSALHRVVPPEPVDLIATTARWATADPIRAAAVDAAVDNPPGGMPSVTGALGVSLLSVSEVRAASVDGAAAATLLGLRNGAAPAAPGTTVFAEMSSTVSASAAAAMSAAPPLPAVDNDMGPLVARVSQVMGDAASAGLAAGLQASLPDNLVKVTNNTVSRVTARKLLKSLTVSLTDSLTATLLLAISRPLVHHTTRMLTHALTPAIMYPATSIIARALTHNPRGDYYCWYCATTGQTAPAPGQQGVPLYCDYCQRAQEYNYNIDYYAQYFARHYTSYYAEFYSNGAGMEDMIRLRDPILEEILNISGSDPVIVQKQLYGKNETSNGSTAPVPDVQGGGQS